MIIDEICEAQKASVMRLLSFVLFFIVVACGGSLSDEQRKEMRQRMEESKILRVTEAEITEAAFAQGRETVAKLDSLGADSSMLKSFIAQHEGRIRFVTPESSDSHLLERQLIDAYLADPSGNFQDNVQKVRNSQADFDTLLYTKPVTRKLAEGREELVGVWNIWLPKKDLVLEIGKHK
jgi:hypothetical protein